MQHELFCWEPHVHYSFHGKKKNAAPNMCHLWRKQGQIQRWETAQTNHGKTMTTQLDYYILFQSEMSPQLLAVFTSFYR